jgi:DNA-binding NtrC family response regulator
MLDVFQTLRENHSVMVLRPARSGASLCSHADMLGHGIVALDVETMEAAYRAVQNGCRVGVLLLTEENDLAHLDRCEPFLCMSDVSWVGLIARELLAQLRVREFIGTYLFNFLTLPSSPEHIVLTLRHACGMALVRDSCRRSGVEAMKIDAGLSMIGKSEKMLRLFAQIKKVARSDATVLISGPSGTGKELAAQALHRHSTRRNAPFVAVNCGSLAPQLLQSELFGYEKGAFTGAHQRRVGRIEAARGGTLFLDEIGDMPLDMQVNLLRVLQERMIVRVGGNEAAPVDVRVIAATHIDLAEAVRQGRFRDDLYYRINVVCIEMPRLAERGEDIIDIAHHYFQKFSRMHNQRLRGFSKAAIEAMMRHAWPGNVRELVNRVQRAVVMAEGRHIRPDDLGLVSDIQHETPMSLEDARALTDRVMIHRALSQAGNQISPAASMLGVSRMTLYRLLEKYDMRAPGIPGPAAGVIDGMK